jgi:hypothetical protein
LRRNKHCVYMDGEWSPAGGQWTWKRGEWILAPSGCYYAPPQTTYEEFKAGAALVHRPGVWHPKTKSDVECADPRPCPVSQGK